jgi:uncharacterized protein YcbX
MMRVVEIRIYPVKGLRGLSVGDALVEPWGLAGDRRFMVVDRDGRYLTQRQLPRMALIETGFVAGGIELSAPGADRIAVATPDKGGPRTQVAIWRDRVAARDAGAEAAAWLSVVLATPCRLVHMPDPDKARPVDPGFAAAEDRVSFADGFPVLVTNAASLADLNVRLERPVDMDRFRTNLVVDGAEPWDEDDWRRLRVGATFFAAPKDCARCAVTTVDQATGVRSDRDEPLRTLASFRRKAGGRIIFGQNLIPRTLGRIAVGQDVEPLAPQSVRGRCDASEGA